jgi:hypothetical protein
MLLSIQRKWKCLISSFDLQYSCQVSCIAMRCWLLTLLTLLCHHCTRLAPHHATAPPPQQTPIAPTTYAASAGADTITAVLQALVAAVHGVLAHSGASECIDADIKPT